MGRLTVRVLGSAAGGGFPQWNCRCPVCALAWAGDARVKRRTQAGIAVSAGKGSWVLVNASPDLGEQIRGTRDLHPQHAMRGSPIDAVVLTGAEIDQIAGLLSLREGTPFPLYATPETHAAIAANVMFGALSAMTCRPVQPDEPFMPTSNIRVCLFAVPGKVPLYMESADEMQPSTQNATNVGVEFESDGAKIVFVPGAAAFDRAMVDRSARADVVLFDGTLFNDDEMIRAGLGRKTGRRMGHMPIDGVDGSLQALAGLSARRIFIHINNSNPILIEDSPERAKVEAAGWEVAEDGMEIVL
jgi:pyrroloquinoline quinone biosynthesis protein B